MRTSRGGAGRWGVLAWSATTAVACTPDPGRVHRVPGALGMDEVLQIRVGLAESKVLRLLEGLPVVPAGHRAGPSR